MSFPGFGELLMKILKKSNEKNGVYSVLFQGGTQSSVDSIFHSVKIFEKFTDLVSWQARFIIRTRYYSETASLSFVVSEKLLIITYADWCTKRTKFWERYRTPSPSIKVFGVSGKLSSLMYVKRFFPKGMLTKFLILVLFFGEKGIWFSVLPKKVFCLKTALKLDVRQILGI